MKKNLRKIFFGILPVVCLVVFGIWYQRNSEESIQYEKTFARLKEACQESAKGEVQENSRSSNHVSSVCGCFAKSALRHRQIAVAGIINDQEVVHAILRDCSRKARNF